jgi:membrane associated rhomboid family serine protease
MDSTLWIVMAAVFFGYGGLIAGWQSLLRRWQLAGPDAPPPQRLGRREHVARRNLKALLAFDALVVVPGVAAVLVLSVIHGDLRPAAVMLLPLALFVLPVPTLLKNVRALESWRTAGLEPTEAQLTSTGHASLDDVLRRPAPATVVTAGLIVASSLLCMFDERLTVLFQKQNEAIRAGELWRLFTVALVHGGPVHLFFNVWIFYSVAGIVERLCGVARMQAIFWLGTAAGTLASVATFPAPSVGASGGVFALMGGLWAVAYRHRHELPPTARARFGRSTATVIGVNVLLGFSLPHVDWAAHLGGLAGGAVLGFLLGLGPAARAAVAPQRGSPRVFP